MGAWRGLVPAGQGGGGGGNGHGGGGTGMHLGVSGWAGVPGTVAWLCMPVVGMAGFSGQIAVFLQHLGAGLHGPY